MSNPGDDNPRLKKTPQGRKAAPAPARAKGKLQGADGKFAPGNPGGPGNPWQRRTLALRRLVMEAVSDEDVTAITKQLIDLAKAGELAAIKELFDRLMGRVKAAPDSDPDGEEAPRPIDEIVAECLAVLAPDKPLRSAAKSPPAKSARAARKTIPEKKGP